MFSCSLTVKTTISKEMIIWNLHSGTNLSGGYAIIIQNSQTSRDYIFFILQYFSTKLHNFTKLSMLFQTVLNSDFNGLSDRRMIGCMVICFHEHMTDMDRAGASL